MLAQELQWQVSPIPGMLAPRVPSFGGWASASEVPLASPLQVAQFLFVCHKSQSKSVPEKLSTGELVSTCS